MHDHAKQRKMFRGVVFGDGSVEAYRNRDNEQAHEVEVEVSDGEVADGAMVAATLLVGAVSRERPPGSA